jgi:hypothetical protein
VNGIYIEDVGMHRTPLSCKPVRLLMIFALVLIVSLPIIRPFEVVTAQTPDQSQDYNREFAWNYGGNHWTWNLSIPVALYDAYKAVPDSTRTRNGPSGYDMMITTKDSYIESLSEKLNETATQLGYGSYDKINFVLAFVQSITYSSDFNTTGYEEYPRFPIESLVDQTGDCDCKAIFFAALTLTMGYGTVFINPTDHLAVGVLGNDLHGTYWTYKNQTYYYAETTGTGFKIGDLPDEFKGQSAYIYPIDESNQYVLDSQGASVNAPNLTISPFTGDAPTPTPNSGTAPINTPNISQPTMQPVQPISLNLISDSPIFFIIVVVAIGISIAITIKTAKNPRETKLNKQTLSTQPSLSQSGNPNPQDDKPLDKIDATLETGKFCIFCGSSNKSFASYCEKCGKQIA